jgi:hypothetical protein
VTLKLRPPAQKIQPMGFSGRREATTAPTVVNVKASKARRTIAARLGKIRAEALKNPSTPQPKAANGKEIAHIDHAIQVAARALIPAIPCSCSLARSVTTPLYTTTVSQALRGKGPKEYPPVPAIHEDMVIAPRGSRGVQNTGYLIRFSSNSEYSSNSLSQSDEDGL